MVVRMQPVAELRLAGGARNLAGRLVASYAARVWAISLAGLLGRLLFIGYQPLWRDEAFTAVVVQRPLGEMLAAVRGDSAPPLLYLVDHAVTLVSASASALRLVPPIAGAGAIPPVAPLGRRAGGGGSCARVERSRRAHVRAGNHARAGGDTPAPARGGTTVTRALGGIHGRHRAGAVHGLLCRARGGYAAAGGATRPPRRPAPDAHRWRCGRRRGCDADSLADRCARAADTHGLNVLGSAAVADIGERRLCAVSLRPTGG